MDLHAMSDEAPRYLGLAPYLYYTDATEAVEWLTRVFGFRRRCVTSTPR